MHSKSTSGSATNFKMDKRTKLILEKIESLIKKDKRYNLETYNDYPQGAVNNAKRAIEWKEKNGSSCGTRVGWTRAAQIARKGKLSRDTIARMASFKRHQQHKDVPYTEGCGGLMWDAWGGSAGVNWAISKLKEIDLAEVGKRGIRKAQKHLTAIHQIEIQKARVLQKEMHQQVEEQRFQKKMRLL